MIYQASKHGDNKKAFNEKCKNKSPTLIIIESENNEIFGGFTNWSWTVDIDEDKYGNDKDAFLFSLTNKKVFDVIKPEKAIINYKGED